MFYLDTLFLGIIAAATVVSAFCMTLVALVNVRKDEKKTATSAKVNSPS